jgi:hypothetical protein
MSADNLYGRDAERFEVIDGASGVMLITGDSGIGKSTFLSALTAAWQPTDLVAAPIRLGSVRGSLQSAFATGLGDCLHQYMIAEPEPGRLIWDRLKDVVISAGTGAAHQIGEIAVGVAFTYVESKLGKDATKVIRAALTEVLQPPTDSFDARMAQLIVPDAAAELTNLAREIADYTGRKLVILLDDGERLAADDRGLLAELASIPSDSVRILVCANDSDSHGAEILRIVRGRNARFLRLEALSEPAIEAWLHAEGVQSARWETIVHVSSGYPMFIAEAIRLTKDGISLAEIQVPDSFDVLMEATWQALDQSLQVTATTLAGYADPPDDAFLAAYLGVTPLEFSAARRRLIERGVFVRRADGQAWFHERRRAHLWHRILGQEERRFVAQKAIVASREWLDSHSRIEAWIFGSIPSLVRELSEGERDDYLAKLLTLSREELALLWAMVEIIEPDGEYGQFADTGKIVRYASVRAQPIVNPLAALERLTELELISGAANDQMSITCMVTPHALGLAALIGEIEREFSVRPLQRLATSVFSAFIRDDLAPFNAAAISLGEVSIAVQRSAFGDLQRNEKTFRALEKTPGLGLVFTVDDEPVSVTATFDTAEQRDNARQKILDRSLASSRLTVRRMLDLPPARVRCARYGSLVKELGLDAAKQTMTGAVDLLWHLDHRSRAIAVLREAMDGHEASALGIESTQRYLLDAYGAPQSWVEYEVHGGSDGETVEIHPEGKPLKEDALRDLRLRATGVLKPDEQIVRRTVRYSRDGDVPHPLREVVDCVEKNGRAFNRLLPKVRIAFDGDKLAAAIQAELLVRAGLRAALAADGLANPDTSPGDSLFIGLHIEGQGIEGWSEWIATSFRVADCQGTATVHVLPEGSSLTMWEPSVEELHSIGIEDPTLIRSSGSGIASYVLADDIRFDDTGTPSLDDGCPTRSSPATELVSHIDMRRTAPRDDDVDVDDDDENVPEVTSVPGPRNTLTNPTYGM